MFGGRRWATPEESPDSADSAAFLSIFLLLKFGEGDRRTIAGRSKNGGDTHIECDPELLSSTHRAEMCRSLSASPWPKGASYLVSCVGLPAVRDLSLQHLEQKPCHTGFP